MVHSTNRRCDTRLTVPIIVLTPAFCPLQSTPPKKEFRELLDRLFSWCDLCLPANEQAFAESHRQKIQKFQVQIVQEMKRSNSARSQVREACWPAYAHRSMMQTDGPIGRWEHVVAPTLRRMFVLSFRLLSVEKGCQG